MIDSLRFRIKGLRPYLRADGFITGEWRVSRDFNAKLSEVLERVIRSAMRSADARGKRLLLPSDLDRANLALYLTDQLSKIDMGIPRSNNVVRRGIPTSTENVGSNLRENEEKSDIPRDSR